MPTQITTPQFLHLSAEGSIERPAVAMRVMHDPDAGSYRPVSVTVEHPGVAVGPARLGRMRLGEVRRLALRAALAEANPDLVKIAPVKSFFKGTDGRAVSERVREEPTPAHLDNAALIVRLARLTGDFPVRSVQRCFGIGYDDARRWVKALRENGSIA